MIKVGDEYVSEYYDGVYVVTYAKNNWVRLEPKSLGKNESIFHVIEMPYIFLKRCFTKYEEPKSSNAVTQEMVDEIIENSMIVVDTVFDKTTVAYCQLPNGFVIVESSSCVDPTNYDLDTGADICMDKIENKIWELEGYRLQCELANNNCDNEDDIDPYYCAFNGCECCDCPDENWCNTI